MTNYDKRASEAFSKLRYEDQREMLKELERRNTIFDCQSKHSISSSSSSDANILEPLVDVTVNCMQYIVELCVDVSIGLYKGFKAYREYKKQEIKNISPDVLAELTITKEEE